MVTGIGVVSALGGDRDAFWSALAAGRAGLEPITAVDISGLAFDRGGEARDFRPEDQLDGELLHLADRFAQLTVVAAREAVADSGLGPEDLGGARCGVVTGSCVGGQSSEDQAFVRLYRDGRSRVHPLSVPRIMANAGASLVSMDLGIQGPGFTLSTACSSANHALGQALWMIRAGVVDRALAGGGEAPFSYGNLVAWNAMRVVSSDTCRPFSADRSGMILGEGAAMLVLEEEASARARGARIYAELAGCGMSSDAHHIIQPSENGPRLAMSAALADAGLEPAQVGYINAHGTGTQANDATETAAIRAVFGAQAERLAVSSTKSMHGHALGAAGALEAAATVLAIHQGLLPPTANFTTADPACDLDVVPNNARPAAVEAALSSSFAFGGLNAVLAFKA
ncbi:MAG: beta-ketoacyl-[acyl-carrier-protein] synthase family protein [Thermoanaerobaculia bacterium]